MNCPYCGKAMKEGLIPGDRFSLKWIPEENNKGNLLQWFSKGIKLSDPLMEHGAKSFYCHECEKIVIDVKNKREEYKA